jgi:hypothetical protein
VFLIMFLLLSIVPCDCLNGGTCDCKVCACTVPHCEGLNGRGCQCQDDVPGNCDCKNCKCVIGGRESRTMGNCPNGKCRIPVSKPKAKPQRHWFPWRR